MENNQQSFNFAAQIEIDDSNDQQRIDNFLIKSLKGVPKSRIYRMIRKGEVRINRGRIRAEYRLNIGDIVRIPPVRRAQSRDYPKPAESFSCFLQERILFEDDYFLAINKPSGLPVHGGSGFQSGLIENLRLVRPKLKFLELVHRLDKDTSGCLLVAKKRACLKALHVLFRERRIHKNYTALLAGSWRRKKQTIEAPLRKYIKQSGERKVIVNVDGKPAKTLFRQVRLYESATMIKAKLMTGRTHQVRVHAAHLGFPIAGDDRYGNKSENRKFRKMGLKRLFLHAAELRFLHPASDQPLSIRAPLDENLAEFLAILERNEEI